MNNGPELWNYILAQIPNGIIAGGCVRDYLMGVEAKDVDVFVSDCTYDKFEGWEAHPEAEEYEAGDHVAFVMQRTLEGVTVDLIGLALKDFSGEEIIKTFDFGITRSWYDGEIHDTYEASEDRTNGRITLMIPDRMLRAVRRFERFNERNGNAFTPINFDMNVKEEEELF